MRFILGSTSTLRSCVPSPFLRASGLPQPPATSRGPRDAGLDGTVCGLAWGRVWVGLPRGRPGPGGVVWLVQGHTERCDSKTSVSSPLPSEAPFQTALPPEVWPGCLVEQLGHSPGAVGIRLNSSGFVLLAASLLQKAPAPWPGLRFPHWASWAGFCRPVMVPGRGL